jgi:hypothetical protein
LAGIPPLPRPVTDTPAVRAFCEELVPGQIPVPVRIAPPKGATLDECVENVKSVVEFNDGSIEYGWMLWERPGVMLEAEFHAVWVRPSGSRLDVTPKLLPGMTEIVFLPDPDLVYEERQIDNKRVALADDPLIQQYIDAAEAYFESINRGELADFHGHLLLDAEQQGLLKRRDALEEIVMEKYTR